jgi:hypothetical protein
LKRRNTFTLSTTGSNQGAVNGTVVTAADYDYIIPNTFWNLTQKYPINGPISDVTEEQYVGNAVGISFQNWDMRGGDLYIYPQPAAADSASFQYYSTFWCKSSGGTKKAAWSVDTDIGILDEGLMTLGLIWRWRRANGIDYAQELDIYERRVADAIARQSDLSSIYMDGSRMPAHGIVIPVGSWPL